MRILIISPHPDDTEFAMGGVLSMLKDVSIRVVVVTDGSKWPPQLEHVKELRRREQERAAEISGYELVMLDFEDANTIAYQEEIRHALEAQLHEYGPDLVFCNWQGDFHTDHKTTAWILGQITAYVAWEEYSSLNFDPNVLVDISSVADHKQHLLDIFESQADRVEAYNPFPLNERWGSVIGSAYAEAFSVPNALSEHFQQLPLDIHRNNAYK